MREMDAAPIDGTPILAFGGSPDYHSEYSEHGQDSLHYTPFPSPIVVIWFDKDHWRYCSYDSGYYGEWCDPVGWLPLPNVENET